MDEKIDQKDQGVIESFSILISVASLYVYDYDRYVSTGFTDSVFENLEKKEYMEFVKFDVQILQRSIQKTI